MYFFWHEMFKILTVSGALTPRGSLRRSPDLLAARRFLQFPHGLKSNSVKERWPMRLGGICARGLGGIDASVWRREDQLDKHKTNEEALKKMKEKRSLM